LLQSGALANALMGASPDNSGRSVFAAVAADGSVVQVQVEKAWAGASAGRPIRPLADLGGAGVSRTWMLFNWVPDPILYVAGQYGTALSVVDDGTIFRLNQTRRIASIKINVPIDLAPAGPEIANPRFSSNTTLAGGSDLYVANRGTGTIVRMSQEGTVVATCQAEVPGIGVRRTPERDRRLPRTRTGSGSRLGPQPDFGGVEGAVVEVPALAAPTASYEGAPDGEGSAALGAEVFRWNLISRG
jgi:hypothetical protein